MGMKVFINPGHSPKGDPDPGAVNVDMHLAEWDIADAIGQRVRNYLDFAGCDVVLLQSDNLMGEGEGENVVRTAEAFGADVFVSMHKQGFFYIVCRARPVVYWPHPGKLKYRQYLI